VAVLQENKDVTNLSFPAAAEEMKQLQQPRWRVSFQFEMRIRTKCLQN